MPNNEASVESPHILVAYEAKKSPSKNSEFKKRIYQASQSSRLIETMREEQGKKFRFFPESTVTHFNAMKNFLSSLFTPVTPKSAATVVEEDKTSRDGEEYESYLNATIELAVFVDKELFLSLKETFPEDTDKHVVNVVTAMMNAVQILFDDESLGHKVTLVIKRLEVLKEEPVELKKTVDIQELLNNFCQVSLVKSSKV